VILALGVAPEPISSRRATLPISTPLKVTFDPGSNTRPARGDHKQDQPCRLVGRAAFIEQRGRHGRSTRKSCDGGADEVGIPLDGELVGIGKQVADRLFADGEQCPCGQLDIDAGDGGGVGRADLHQ
jgi:hypothetical protein